MIIEKRHGELQHGLSRPQEYSARALIHFKPMIIQQALLGADRSQNLCFLFYEFVSLIPSSWCFVLYS